MTLLEPEMKPSGLTVSVAIATYHGERFLGEQLESIAGQTRLPDELVIGDDGSTDRTMAILEAFAERAPFEVRIVRNAHQLGHTDNFLKVPNSCRGDLVAFCDQDDVWRPDKLARCAVEFEANDEVVMVIHSGRVIGAGARRRHRYPAFGRRVVATPASLPLHHQAPGFSLVVSRQVLDLWRPGDRSNSAWGEKWWGHDTVVSFWGGALGKTILLPDDLVLYRQHEANQYGAPPHAGLAASARNTTAWVGEEATRLQVTARWASSRAQLIEERLGAGPTDPTTQAADRARLWRRCAAVNERRATLYQIPTGSLAAGRRLPVNIARGDYGSRTRGGSGIPSLGRDALYAAAFLGIARRAMRSTGRPSGGSASGPAASTAPTKARPSE